MQRYIVMSHGLFAQEAVGAIRLIMGDLADNFAYVSVTQDKSPEQVYKEAKALMNKDNEQSYFVFCDIYGGTPFNIALKLLLEGYPLEIYTGFNLMLLLEIAMDYQEEDKLIINKIESITDQLFKHVNDMIEEDH